MEDRYWIAIALFVVWLGLRIFLTHRRNLRRRAWEARQHEAETDSTEKEDSEN